MRPCHNPYGGVNPLIDKMIGNAYDVVKYVARYLKEIRYVAENMQHVFAAANGNRIVLTGTATGASPLLIPLPEGSNVLDFQSVAVHALDMDYQMYFPGPDTFNYGVSGGNVVISIDPSNTPLLTGTFNVLIINSVIPTS